MKFRFFVNEQYRRAQFLEGQEIDDDYVLDVDVSELTREERQLLLDTDNQSGVVPHDIRAAFPGMANGVVEPRLDWWLAKLNPEEWHPSQIVKVWFQEYQAEMNRLEGTK